MSELKAKHVVDVYEAYTKTGDDDAAQVYLKSEVDRCFKEMKSEIERLEILCADYRHDCDNLAISNEQVKRAESTLLKKMNHHKYKRCLAMFNKCQVRVAHCQLLERYEQRNWWRKWMFKWLELADKLKEAK